MIKNFPLLALVLFLLFAVNTISVSAQDDDCANMFNSVCAECHELERSCDLLGQSKKEWIELFEYMEAMDADISEEEQATLLECLTKPADDIKAICKK